MTAIAIPSSARWRWGASLVAVLAFHAVALLLLRQIHPPAMPLVPPQDAVLLDLAPLAPPAPATPPAQPPQPTLPPVTPAVQPPDPTPPDVPQPQIVQPSLIEPTPTVPPLNPEVALPPPPPPPPPRRPVPVKHTPPVHTPRPETPPPPTTETTESTNQSLTQAAPAAPAPPSPGLPPGQATATWESKLVAHLLRFRHYPAEAQRRGLQGVVMMRFSLDGAGHVMSSRITRSSGHDDLDEAAEDWLQRAQPLPAPPPDRVAPFQIDVPFSFILH